jgi:GNAT superfamily N-acetyltransferase
LANPPAGWVIERLGRGHDRSAFDCGNPALNDWLKLRAGQSEKKDLARTFVAARAGSPAVVGYYALASHHLTYEALAEEHAKGLPHIDIPVVLLGRLAVDRSAQGQGLGQVLLFDALRRALRISADLGVRAVEVHAIDAKARLFYLKFGFLPLLDDPNHLILPLRLAAKAWEASEGKP